MTVDKMLYIKTYQLLSKCKHDVHKTHNDCKFKMFMT